ncbi:hypothetical protein IFM89_002092 [Coptis chinensis]|uniref:Apple domain-containing protein n=1 Tax=Coptis chinensis TaxID=261450 RepID=A0A835H3M2_9MAGN|nr:hypothetical protein IFM89_002092 [Coptis chinensis]
MKTPTELTRPIHSLLIIFLLLLLYMHFQVKAQELHKGFSATPDSSSKSFQPLLTDSSNNFSLGFLRVNRSQLTLAILHLPSSEPTWFVNTTRNLEWSKNNKLLFNGSLVLSNSHEGVLWSTQSANGNTLLLHNNSNLQILDSDSVITWQSFDHPTNTLVQNQNFTSEMSLVSSNGQFEMKLGDNFIGLYSTFEQDSKQIYWKHTAMQAKAEIVQGNGPLYSQISLHGYLGTYQTENAPVDVLPFDSFQRPVTGIRRLKLESDGNLQAYYWNGMSWLLDFKAISEECELPSSCGSYGLCKPGKNCECLNNKTEYNHSSGEECFSSQTGNFCEEKEEGFWVLRRNGVDLPYKELMEFEQMDSLDACEDSCEKNCSCWGSVFNNVTGYCYKIDYPIQSLVSVGDENKIGYFKVRTVVEKKRHVGYVIGIGILVCAVLMFFAVAGFGALRIWNRRTRVNWFVHDDGISPGPYRDLGSGSFRSVELCKS